MNPTPTQPSATPRTDAAEPVIKTKRGGWVRADRHGKARRQRADFQEAEGAEMSTAPSEAHRKLANQIRYSDDYDLIEDFAQLIADSEARAVEAATNDQHKTSYALGYKDGWRDGRLPLNNPLPLALSEQHKAVNDAIWVTCSEHEWSWTHEQQVRMARYIMWAAPIIAAKPRFDTEEPIPDSDLADMKEAGVLAPHTALATPERKEGSK